jgi:biopolymer transport protein ExbD
MAKRSKRIKAKVYVPITAMLDMAFNLLTFFVMTFNPTPVEVQFALNLLPAAPVAKPGATASADAGAVDSTLPAALQSLVTTLYAAPDGTLAKITLDDLEISARDLDAKITELVGKPDLPFEQILIQFDPTLRYSELIGIVDRFARQGMTKVSFTQLDASVAGPP